MTDATALHADTLVWDQHGCLPLRPDADAVDELELYRRSGVDVVSINVGFDVTPALDTIKVLAAFRRGVLARPDRFTLVTTAEDVRAAKASGRLAVSFDLEGTEPLDGELALVSTYYDLGVRVFGRESAPSRPSCQRTWITPASRSTSPQRRPSSSPRRRPVKTAAATARCHASPPTSSFTQTAEPRDARECAILQVFCLSEPCS